MTATNVVEITVTMSGTRTDGGMLSIDDANKIAKQIERDAGVGSYMDFSPEYCSWENEPSYYARVTGLERGDDSYRFVLSLSADMLPVEGGGLQHLLGILLGDLFALSIPGYQFQLKVSSVSLPDDYRNATEEAFVRGKAHSIPDIRSEFRLPDKQPLLAFSFKPRIGTTIKTLREVTEGVLKAGFHIVEMDTRDIRLGDGRFAELLDLAKSVVSLCPDHVTRFAINVTQPADQVVDYVQQIVEATPKPHVVKIDGGLDGISACQAVRRHFRCEDGAPIITSYPLLRSSLDRGVGQLFLDSLVLSGADIVYVGGRPTIGTPSRDLGASDRHALLESVSRYRWLTHSQKRPMPTIAGGIYAGQLHAYYDMLGPDVAYFLGGAVALHKDGPVNGAALCATAIKTAMESSSKIGDPSSRDFDVHLIRNLENAYRSPAGAAAAFNYVPPSALYQQNPGLISWMQWLAQNG